MKLFEIINQLRSLANRHKEIEGFYTGLRSESNDERIVYPCVRVNFPLSAGIPFLNEGNYDAYSVSFSFEVLVNSVEVDESDNPFVTSIKDYNTNYLSEDNTINEIMQHNYPTDEMLLRERAFAIANHLVYGLTELQDTPLIDITQISMESLERAYTDVVTGVRVDLSIEVSNDYKCEVDADIVFDEEEIDRTTDFKTDNL